MSSSNIFLPSQLLDVSEVTMCLYASFDQHSQTYSHTFVLATHTSYARGLGITVFFSQITSTMINLISHDVTM